MMDEIIMTDEQISEIMGQMENLGYDPGISTEDVVFLGDIKKILEKYKPVPDPRIRTLSPNARPVLSKSQVTGTLTDKGDLALIRIKCAKCEKKSTEHYLVCPDCFKDRPQQEKCDDCDAWKNIKEHGYSIEHCPNCGRKIDEK